jgi:hypothetical protein
MLEKTPDPERMGPKRMMFYCSSSEIPSSSFNLPLDCILIKVWKHFWSLQINVIGSARLSLQMTQIAFGHESRRIIIGTRQQSSIEGVKPQVSDEDEKTSMIPQRRRS